MERKRKVYDLHIDAGYVARSKYISKETDGAGSPLISGVYIQDSEFEKQIPSMLRLTLEWDEGSATQEVGVGMTITSHPLHGSGRALLTHPALALGDDAKPP